MSRTQTTTKPGQVSRALAQDRLGVPSVLFFVLAGVAPLTVAAGVIPTAFAVTGLTGIPAAFIVIAVIMALFAVGYVAMTRHITNSGAFYAFISRGLGKSFGVAAALIAVLAYNFLQVGLYGALGPAAQGEAAQHLGVHWSWWVWALIAWAIITILGLLRVDITGWVLGVLLSVEVVVIIAETISGLVHPAGGHLSFSTLSPSGLTAGGFGSVGVLSVIAVLGFIGFEQAPVLAEEAKNARRTIPVATYLSLGLIAIVYAGASWSMTANVGASHVVKAAQNEGPGLLFGLGSSGLSTAAQFLFMTSLFAAALAFHNAVWRYMYSLGRESVLPSALGRTGGNNIPKVASATQSFIGLAVIILYAAGGWNPMNDLFFWLGTTGGFGILVLFGLTSIAVIAYFSKDAQGENLWRRALAPAIAAVLLIGLIVLALMHYDELLGVTPNSPAAWMLPVSYLVIAVIGLGWGLVLRSSRPQVYAAIGLGAHAELVPSIGGIGSHRG
jgi:amino acid transporter